MQLWVKASKTWTFSFAISETFLGKILLKKTCTCLDIIRPKQRTELQLWPGFKGLWISTLFTFTGLGSRVDNDPSRWWTVSGEGSVSTSKLHLSTTGTKRKRPQLSWEEQEHHLHTFLKLPRKSAFLSAHSFSRANLSLQHGRSPAQGVTG